MKRNGFSFWIGAALFLAAAMLMTQVICNQYPFFAASGILQFVVLYSENGKYDPLFMTNYTTINVLDELSRTPGVGEAKLFGRLNYSMRI